MPPPAVIIGAIGLIVAMTALHASLVNNDEAWRALVGLLERAAGQVPQLCQKMVDIQVFADFPNLGMNFGFYVVDPNNTQQHIKLGFKENFWSNNQVFILQGTTLTNVGPADFMAQARKSMGVTQSDAGSGDTAPA